MSDASHARPLRRPPGAPKRRPKHDKSRLERRTDTAITRERAFKASERHVDTSASEDAFVARPSNALLRDRHLAADAMRRAWRSNAREQRRTLHLCLLRTGLGRDVRRAIVRLVPLERLVVVGGVSLLDPANSDSAAAFNVNYADHDHYLPPTVPLDAHVYAPCRTVLSIDPFRRGSVALLPPLPVALLNCRSAFHAPSGRLWVFGRPTTEETLPLTSSSWPQRPLVALFLDETHRWKRLVAALPPATSDYSVAFGTNELLFFTGTSRAWRIHLKSGRTRALPPCNTQVSRGPLVRVRPLVAGTILFVLRTTAQCADPWGCYGQACGCCPEWSKEHASRCCTVLQMLDLADDSATFVDLPVPAGLHCGTRPFAFDRVLFAFHESTLVLSSAQSAILTYELDLGTEHDSLWRTQQAPLAYWNHVSLYKTSRVGGIFRLSAQLHLTADPPHCVALAPRRLIALENGAPAAMHVWISGASRWVVAANNDDGADDVYALRYGYSTLLAPIQ